MLSLFQALFFVLLIFFHPLVSAGFNPDEHSRLHPESLPQKPDEQFKKAVNLFNLKMYKEAENILLDFVSDDRWQEKTYFLLGRLYKEQGLFDRAEDFFKKIVDWNSLLKDYALNLLTDIYIAEEKFDEAVVSAGQIQNKALLKKAGQYEITALLAMKKEEEAIRALYRFVKRYPEEWESKLILGRLLKKSDKKQGAITLLKDVYINASPQETEALNELEAMDADVFTQKERLKRAENLFEKGDFQKAEVTYKEVFQNINDSALKAKVRFAVAMCQFRQKKYHMAAESFGFIEDPEAMFLKAKAHYRINELEGFNGMIKKFEVDYPKSEYRADLLLVFADELRRTNRVSESEKFYKNVLKDFPEKAEEALWGLGWMKYSSGNYKEAVKYFSELTSSVKNGEYYKYLYWEAKGLEMLARDCIGQKPGMNTQEKICPGEASYHSAYSRLSADSGYYGFLAKMRLRGFETPERIEVTRPEIPEGKVYERIEALKILGMNKEAAEEIKVVLKLTKGYHKLKYLGYTAVDVGEYVSIIYLVENIKDREFLPLSYPLGYWNIVRKAADKESVDEYLIVALIREESRFDPEVVSVAGAIGLMQLMPSTAHRIKKYLKIELKDNSEIHDEGKNIHIGTHYLSLLIRKFKEIPLALAAYNAGEDATKRWLFESNHKDIDEFIEDIPYRETRRYVKKVLKSYWQYRAINGVPIEGYRLLCNGKCDYSAPGNHRLTKALN